MIPDVLLDCHQRLRQVTARAGALAARPSAPADEVREVAARLHRYFSIALRVHEEDEERSLFPRLVARAPALATVVAGLRQDHAAQADGVAVLVALGQELQTSPERFPALRGGLATATGALLEVWTRHLSIEEAELFPAVHTALTTEDRAAIEAEMQARRALLPR